MKKIYIVLLAILLTLALCTTAAANEISVNLDGSQLSFDVPPTVENGRTLVPLSAIFEVLGAMLCGMETHRQ